MTEKDILIKSIEHEFPITLKVIKAFPADKDDYRPHERSQTAKQIVETIVAELQAIQKMLQGEENLFVPLETASIAEAISRYEQTYTETLAFLKSTSLDEFEKPINGMMGQFFPSRMAGVWTFANDTIHHRGQLSVYIRLAGGKV
ncbi:MAG: DinB family protein, partial [bacterium]|nr:DinB family protein [bacterium]